MDRGCENFETIMPLLLLGISFAHVRVLFSRFKENETWFLCDMRTEYFGNSSGSKVDDPFGDTRDLCSNRPLQHSFASFPMISIFISAMKTSHA